MESNRQPPLVFISYSWTSTEHQNRVIELAERLTGDGIHVLIDVWDLQAGQDKNAFMEKMVTDPNIKRVLMIIDKKYAEKADKRIGGVGSESQIISEKIYKSVDENKFIPIVFELDDTGSVIMPAYAGSRIYIDLANNSTYSDEYEKLLRNIFERPVRRRPQIGLPPAFLKDDSKIPAALKFHLERMTTALENGRADARGHLRRYLSSTLITLREFAIRTDPEEEIDERVLHLIHELTPIRDQVISALETVCDFSESLKLYDEFTFFFKDCIELQFRPRDLNQWNEYWFDHYHFFFRETLLYFVALLIKQRKFLELQRFIDFDYNYRNENGTLTSNISVFDQPMQSLDRYRNDRLGLNLISLSSSLINERVKDSQFSILALAEADVIISLKCGWIAKNSYEGRWFPSTTLYLNRFSHALPLFEKFSRGETSEEIGILFGIRERAEFAKRLDEVLLKSGAENWRFDHFRPIPFRTLCGVLEH